MLYFVSGVAGGSRGAKQSPPLGSGAAPMVLCMVFHMVLGFDGLFRLQGDAFVVEGFFLRPVVDPVQWEICGIDSCGERIWRAAKR